MVLFGIVFFLVNAQKIGGNFCRIAGPARIATPASNALRSNAGWQSVAGGGVRIIDYKTGRKKEKLEKQDKTQLLIYQIAVEEFLKLTPVELVYHYLEDGQRHSFLGTEQDKQRIKQDIIETIDKIKTSDFKATPGWQCQYCDFRGICHFVANDNSE